MSKKIESMSRTMKDSGIPWIGEIPEGWRNAKYRYSGIFVKGKLPCEQNVEQHGKPIIGASEMLGKEYRNFSLDANVPTCQKQDILILWDGANAGIVANNCEGIVSSTVVKYVCTDKNIDSQFLFYLFKNGEPFFKSKVNGTTIPHMNQKFIDEYLCILPPLAEQHLIATFLDKKCSEIDSLIELQEQMIEELKAYKQSVITEAVTKGLNPNVPMKDSGIEWIGDVPEEWEVCRLKNHIALNPSISIVILPETVVSYMPMECLRNGVIQERRASYKDVASYTPFQDNDIVMAKVTPCFENGNIAVAKNLSSGYGFGTSEIFVIRCKETANNQFVFYYLQSAYIKNLGVSSMTGTGGLKRVNPTLLNNGVLLLPPLAEQQVIADYLDKKCGEIDELIIIKQQKIESLKEYKKSVIYEYVTGKKEP